MKTGNYSGGVTAGTSYGRFSGSSHKRKGLRQKPDLTAPSPTGLLADMDAIVDTMHAANGSANVIVLTIPCWTQHSNGNSDATHQAVETYNASPEFLGAVQAGRHGHRRQQRDH